MTDMDQSAIPEHCPGTESDMAGKADACAGCPNQKACESAPKGPDPDIALIADRLKDIKHTLVILSGKGGVGKSTFSAQLAQALADCDWRVGVLDIDICGPSMPKILGVEGESVHQSASGWSPVYVDENLAVISIGFLLPDPDTAVIWKGPKKNGMIKQFLRDVEWGPLDYLIIDTPPGTSDEHLSVVKYLSDAGVDGAVIVTTPQEVALSDVKREVNFCNKVDLPILGVVENMSGFVCPKCSATTAIFPATTGGATQMCREFSLSMLGSLPIDPSLARACDEGASYFDRVAHDSPGARAFHAIFKNVLSTLGETYEVMEEEEETQG